MRIKRELLHYPPITEPVSPYPLLFIHGAWHGAWCWEPYFLPYFAAAGYHCYALSLSGHAGSWITRSLRFIGINDYVEDVVRVAHQLERTYGLSPVLIGHSMGGYVVQKFLERYTVPAAALLAPIPSVGTFPFTLRMLRDYPMPCLRTLITLRGYPFIGTPQLAHALFFSADMPADQATQYHARLQDESMLILLQSGLLNTPRPAQMNKIPMLVLAAMDDKVFTVDEATRTAVDYNAELVVIPALAHDVMLDPKWQTAAERLKRWLRQTLDA